MSTQAAGMRVSMRFPRIFPRMSMRFPRMEVKDEGIKGRG